MLRLGADHRPSPRHRTLTIKEGKYALKWTRLSCRRFRDNQARLPLFALAYNLANFLRELALPRPIQKDLPGIHDNPCRNLGRSAFERTTAYLLGAQGARLISNSSRVPAAQQGLAQRPGGRRVEPFNAAAASERTASSGCFNRLISWASAASRRRAAVRPHVPTDSLHSCRCSRSCAPRATFFLAARLESCPSDVATTWISPSAAREQIVAPDRRRRLGHERADDHGGDARRGRARSYEDGDLGNFGLGLKTASMSQCRKLTVASRTAYSRDRAPGYIAAAGQLHRDGRAMQRPHRQRRSRLESR